MRGLAQDGLQVTDGQTNTAAGPNPGQLLCVPLKCRRNGTDTAIREWCQPGERWLCLLV